MTSPTTQLRIRLSNPVAQRFILLPPRARSRAISLLVASACESIDLKKLLKFRYELASLGTLINQALRSSWGKTTDAEAMKTLQKKLEVLLK